MTPLNLAPIEEYLEGPSEMPRLAREYLQALVEEVKWYRRFSESQEEALRLMERGLL